MPFEHCALIHSPARSSSVSVSVTKHPKTNSVGQSPQWLVAESCLVFCGLGLSSLLEEVGSFPCSINGLGGYK